MSNFKYICSGNSWCLIPNYMLSSKHCKNYSVCFNNCDDSNKDNFCNDCLNLPFENKKRIIDCVKQNECSICLKITNIVVKREECEHFICVHCFRKIFFGKSLYTPIFPYLNEKYDENTDYGDDVTIIIYKKDLEYWKLFQTIDHDDNKICKKCIS